MIIIIAGGRDIDDYNLVVKAIKESGFNITEVVSGCCRGVDNMGEEWAIKNSIPITPFSANWTKHGKAAGPIRNSEMSNYADGLIALWDGISRGTKDMIDKAKAKGLKVFVYTVPGVSL